MTKAQTAFLSFAALFLLLCALSCSRGKRFNYGGQIKEIQQINSSLIEQNQVLIERLNRADSLLKVQEVKNSAYEEKIKDLQDDLEDVISFLNGIGY